MQTTSIFDVLIVYTNGIASSASSKNLKNENPFSLAKNREHYSDAYSYFLEKCHELGLKAAFTTTIDIVGPGKCKTYWIYKNKNWKKVNKYGFSKIIFDKFSPNIKALKIISQLLFSDGVSTPFNDHKLMVIFNDKLKTFKKFKFHTIPTVNITQDTIKKSILKLKLLTNDFDHREDFANSIILKDRFGSGGNNIYKIKSNSVARISKILKSMPATDFVLQPFVNFDRGFAYKKINNFVDFRIIYSNGKVIQRYIRIAKEKDFRCNEHQGGEVRYVDENLIPLSVINLSNKILKIIDNNKTFFALDFLLSNDGNAYLVEGNINPGIYWGVNKIEDKKNTKKLIREIVAEILFRSKKEVIIGNKNFMSSINKQPVGEIINII